MKAVCSISAREMLEAWAIAEATSVKAPLGQAIEKADTALPLRKKVLDRRYDLLTRDEWDVLVRAIQQTRAPLLATLLELDPPMLWEDTLVSIEEIRAFRFFAMQAWMDKWPSQLLVDLCGGRVNPGQEPEFRGWLTAIERPIAVGHAPDGPFTLIEGYTRICTLLRDVEAGLHDPGDVRMIVGWSPSLINGWVHPRSEHPWW